MLINVIKSGINGVVSKKISFVVQFIGKMIVRIINGIKIERDI